MITEDYVSFETAKLLKEKGIEDDCEYTGWIGESGNHYFPDDTYLDDDEMIAVQKDRKEFIPLISLQMAMKWLREVHNLHINLDIHWLHFINSSGWIYIIDKIVENGVEYIDSKGDENDKTIYSTYEEAAEAAIKYCLENLI